MRSGQFRWLDLRENAVAQCCRRSATALPSEWDIGLFRKRQRDHVTSWTVVDDRLPWCQINVLLALVAGGSETSTAQGSVAHDLLPHSGRIAPIDYVF